VIAMLVAPLEPAIRRAGGGKLPTNRTAGPRLFTLAAHFVIPVYERTVRVVPPGPDVQFEVRRQAVAIRAGDVLERLSLEHRRTVVMGQPHVGNDYELHANQLQTCS
jgi:hypothetical protein